MQVKRAISNVALTAIFLILLVSLIAIFNSQTGTNPQTASRGLQQSTPLPIITPPPSPTFNATEIAEENLPVPTPVRIVRPPEIKTDAGVANLRPLNSQEPFMFSGWSADGSLVLAYKITRDHVIDGSGVLISLSELRVVSSENGETRMKLSEAAGVWTWSPDGKYVLFTEPTDPKGGPEANLLMANLASRTVEFIAKGDLTSGLNPNIQWLPTGHIFFGRGSSLYRVDPSGANLSIATPLQFVPLFGQDEAGNSVQGGAISVCPDESKVAYTLPMKDAPWISELWIANTDGTSAVKVIESVPDFSWNPDCTQLAFSHIRKYAGTGYESSIMIVDRDGKSVKEIVPASQSDETNQFPQWANSGKWIVYSRLVPNFDPYGWWLEHQIWKVDPNGEKATVLVEHAGPRPYLSADDRLLAFNAQVEPNVQNAFVAEVDLNK